MVFYFRELLIIGGVAARDQLSVLDNGVSCTFKIFKRLHYELSFWQCSSVVFQEKSSEAEMSTR